MSNSKENNDLQTTETPQQDQFLIAAQNFSAVQRKLLSVLTRLMMELRRGGEGEDPMEHLKIRLESISKDLQGVRRNVR